MSRRSKEKITCPECGKESECILWDSINTEMDPDMKAKVRSGEAFRWTCPECGYQTNLDYPTLYHQMEDHVMIYYVPGDKTEAVQLMKGFVDGKAFGDIDPEIKLDIDYRNRVVGTKTAFREKIMILDAGLDDRVMEVLKLLLTSQLMHDDPDLQIDEFLFHVADNGDKSFFVRLGDGKWATAGYTQDMYDTVARDFKEAIDKDTEVIIDKNWAYGIIKDHFSEEKR